MAVLVPILSLLHATTAGRIRLPEEHRNLLPDYWNILPEDRGLLQENQNLLPENRNLLPEYGTFLPEDRNLPPEYRNLLPEYRNLLSEYRNILPEDRSLIQENQDLLREHRNLLSEHRNLLPEHRNLLSSSTLPPFQPLPPPPPATHPGVSEDDPPHPGNDQSFLPSQVSPRRLQAVEASRQGRNISGRYNDRGGYSKRPDCWEVPKGYDVESSGPCWKNLVDKAPRGHDEVVDEEQGAPSGSSPSGPREQHQRLQEEVDGMSSPRVPRADPPPRYKSPAGASARLSRWLLWDPLVRLLSLSLSGGGPECRTSTGLEGVCSLGALCSKGLGTGAGSASANTCDNGYGTCCVNQVGCGDIIKANKTYFISNASTSGTCPVKVFKISNEICHLRLDLMMFRLKGTTAGSCQRDVFLVSGHNVNAFVPNLCGNNDGQHLYVDVDTVPGPLELNVITVGEGLQRRVNVLVTQIPCNSAHRPPPNCLQYYTGTHGGFASFNYGQNGTNTYQNDMNYAICLRKEAGFCSIAYSTADLTMSTTYKFEVVNFIITSGTATSVVPAGEAGVGVASCSDDFLVLGGTRLCGDRLNDGRDPVPTNNAPVTDVTNGPFIVQFQSNSESVGGGFRLSYQQQPC